MLGTLGIFGVAIFGFARAPNIFSLLLRDLARIELGRIQVLEASENREALQKNLPFW